MLIETCGKKMNKNRLLIFQHYGGIGGSGISLFHLLKSIDQDHFEIFLACPFAENGLIDLVSNEVPHVNIIKTINTPKIYPHYSGGIKTYFSLKTLVSNIQIYKDYKNVKKIINDVSPDYVFLNSMTLSWIN